MGSEKLKKLFRRLSRRHKPVDIPNTKSVYHRTYEMNMFYREMVTNQAAAKAELHRQVKKAEKPAFEQFIHTGVPGELKVYLAQHGVVQVIGNRIQNNRVLMNLDKETITANATRSSHIKKLLQELADREGLTLRFVTSELEVGKGISVAFWNFKNRKEVNDTELVSKAQLKVNAPNSDAIKTDNEILEQWITTRPGVYDRGQVVRFHRL